MIKIFHCGDLHLDAPFSGVSPQESSIRRKSLLDRFTEMMKYAQNSACDIILISGDLFDCGFVQPLTVKTICDTFAALPCPVVITPGNHDPYTADSVYKTAPLPSNVHLFTTESLSRIDFDSIGISVGGYAFTSKAHPERPLMHIDASHLSDKNVNILCAHTDIYSPISSYAPIIPGELESSGYVYAALGHVHKTPSENRFGECLAAYCGFAEGRGFDECGEGGAWLVSIDNSSLPIKTTLERVCVSKSRYEIRSIDITGADCDATAAGMIDKIISDEPLLCSDECSVRVILTGDIPLTYSPSLNTIARLVKSSKGIELKDNTLPTYDIEYLERDLSVKGEFYRMLRPALSTGTPEEKQVAALALRYGLSAMSGQDIIID